jgi:hypothetical protein
LVAREAKNENFKTISLAGVQTRLFQQQPSPDLR